MQVSPASGSLDVIFLEASVSSGGLKGNDDTPLRVVCAVQSGSLQPGSSSLTDIPTKSRKEDWNATGKFSLLSPVTHWVCRVEWKLPLGEHTQLVLHSSQRLYILNSCCLCLAFNLAAQLPETNLQGTPVTLAFQSYLTCTHSLPLPATHIVYLHFIFRTRFISGGAYLI